MCILHQHLINISLQASKAVSRASVAPEYGLSQRKHEDRGSRCTKSKILFILLASQLFIKEYFLFPILFTFRVIYHDISAKEKYTKLYPDNRKNAKVEESKHMPEC